MLIRPEIETLVREVARRHDRFLARRVAVLSLLAGSGVLVALSLFWVFRGHSVPREVIAGTVITAVVAGLFFWWSKRMGQNAAIRETDRFFDLKDGIATARHLAVKHPDDPATLIQWHWLEPRLTECRPQEIKEAFPKRPASAAVLLAIIAAGLGLMPPSASVRAAEEIARETRERVGESKKELEQLIEELEKEIVAPEEKEALKMDEFRKLVKSIDETGNRAEAARQFARIEQKIRDASRALDQQRDEQTLKLAAQELAKAEETEARQLGKKLDAKDLKEAAEMLEKMAAKKIDPKELQKDPAAKKKALTEAKEELAKMRAASKRLAAAGKQRQGARQAGGGQGAGNQGENGQMGEGAGEQGELGEQGKPLEDMMAELDDAAAEAEKDLEEIEMDPDAEPGEGDGEAMARANGMLDKMGKHMRGMNGKRMAKSKLDQLRQGLAQAQAFSQGESQMLGLAQAGGKQAGTGSSWSQRQEKDDSQKNGSLAQLQGQHGAGPSLSSVEEAESGTGVSSRKGEVKQREFARQVESFVQRDDVPESLKLGVRNYFENLQSAQATPPPGEEK